MYRLSFRTVANSVKNTSFTSRASGSIWAPAPYQYREKIRKSIIN